MIACVSYYSNEEMITVIHNCVYTVLLQHVSAFVESNHQACKKINKERLFVNNS
jgi:hypothetical protein